MGAVVLPLGAQWLTVPIASTPTGAQQRSGIYIPAGVMITEALLRVTTPEVVGSSGAPRMNVGLYEAGVPYAHLLAGTYAGAVGVWQGSASFDDFTRGSSLYTDLSDGIVPSPRAPTVFVTDQAYEITYKADGADWTAFRGKIHILYFPIPA